MFLGAALFPFSHCEPDGLVGPLSLLFPFRILVGLLIALFVVESPAAIIREDCSDQILCVYRPAALRTCFQFRFSSEVWDAGLSGDCNLEEHGAVLFLHNK